MGEPAAVPHRESKAKRPSSAHAAERRAARPLQALAASIAAVILALQWAA